MHDPLHFMQAKSLGFSLEAIQDRTLTPHEVGRITATKFPSITISDARSMQLGNEHSTSIVCPDENLLKHHDFSDQQVPLDVHGNHQYHVQKIGLA